MFSLLLISALLSDVRIYDDSVTVTVAVSNDVIEDQAVISYSEGKITYYSVWGKNDKNEWSVPKDLKTSNLTKPSVKIINATTVVAKIPSQMLNDDEWVLTVDPLLGKVRLNTIVKKMTETTWRVK